MRAIFLLISFSGFSSFALAQEVTRPVVWETAFTPVTSGQADDHLVLMLISNDAQVGDQQVVTREKNAKDNPDKAAKVPARPAKDQSKQSIWCKPDFEFSYQRVLAKRADLADVCSLQSVAAGMPKHLTGEKDRNQPRRCLVAICDGHYRLLSFCVGTPSPDELLTLIEDAQEVISLIKLSGSEQAEITKPVAQRSVQRLTRLWQYSLKETLATIDVGASDDENEAKKFDVLGVYSRLTSTFQDVYFADVKLRFGLTEASDRTRLAVLEQHPQTRQPWCDSMMPFLASADFVQLWRPLASTLWHHDPVTLAKDESSDLVDWYDSIDKTKTIVLDLQPQNDRKRPVLKIAANDAKHASHKKGIDWEDLQTLVAKFPSKNVDTQQLSGLVCLRGITGVDLFSPSQARYLVIKPNDKSAWAIRQGESPVKSYGRLKRLVKQ